MHSQSTKITWGIILGCIFSLTQRQSSVLAAGECSNIPATTPPQIIMVEQNVSIVNNTANFEIWAQNNSTETVQSLGGSNTSCTLEPGYFNPISAGGTRHMFSCSIPIPTNTTIQFNSSNSAGQQRRSFECVSPSSPSLSRYLGRSFIPNCGNGAIDPGEECDSVSGCYESDAGPAYECQRVDPICSDDRGISPTTMYLGTATTATVFNYNYNVVAHDYLDYEIQWGDGQGIALLTNSVNNHTYANFGTFSFQLIKKNQNSNYPGGDASCTATIFVEGCGDGTINGPETCDDGALNGQPNQCNSSCTGITGGSCGNGIVEAGESCDDNNTGNGDGCDGLCNIESGWQCTNPVNQPSTCTPICGDGNIVGSEFCDSNAIACTTNNGYNGTQSCNGTCSGREACVNVGEGCGDAICNGGEDAINCYVDCGSCGDSICTTTDEDANSCYTDCGSCGDSICTTTDENATSCPQDCGVCGDNVCSPSIGEDANSCYTDCGSCGDTICTIPDEDANACPQDCGSCGDDICSPSIGEDANSCYADCGVCGDGSTNSPENCDDGNTTNNDGCDEFCNFESPTCSLINFSALPNPSTANTTINFSANTVNRINYPLLQRGDGTTINNAIFPLTHQYAAEGTYNATVTIEHYESTEQANCVETVIIEAECGNQILETGEQCDDGNTNSLDGCDALCQFEEICNTLNINRSPSTSSQTKMQINSVTCDGAGNGTYTIEVRAGEANIGTPVASYSANPAFTPPNYSRTFDPQALGQIFPPLEFNDGEYYVTCKVGNNQPATCIERIAYCGDGVVQTNNSAGENEQCDDGNSINNDGCDASCQQENRCTKLNIDEADIVTSNSEVAINDISCEGIGDGTYEIIITDQDGNEVQNFQSNNNNPDNVASWLYTPTLPIVLPSGKKYSVACIVGGQSSLPTLPNDICSYSLSYCGDGVIDSQNGEFCEGTEEEGCDDQCQPITPSCTIQADPATGIAPLTTTLSIATTNGAELVSLFPDKTKETTLPLTPGTMIYSHTYQDIGEYTAMLQVKHPTVAAHPSVELTATCEVVVGAYNNVCNALTIDRNNNDQDNQITINTMQCDGSGIGEYTINIYQGTGANDLVYATSTIQDDPELFDNWIYEVTQAVILSGGELYSVECIVGEDLGNNTCLEELSYCGDGILAGDEQCDDGNSTNDDGCTLCILDELECDLQVNATNQGYQFKEIDITNTSSWATISNLYVDKNNKRTLQTIPGQTSYIYQYPGPGFYKAQLEIVHPYDDTVTKSCESSVIISSSSTECQEATISERAWILGFYHQTQDANGLIRESSDLNDGFIGYSANPEEAIALMTQKLQSASADGEFNTISLEGDRNPITDNRYTKINIDGGTGKYFMQISTNPEDPTATQRVSFDACDGPSGGTCELIDNPVASLALDGSYFLNFKQLTSEVITLGGEFHNLSVTVMTTDGSPIWVYEGAFRPTISWVDIGEPTYIAIKVAYTIDGATTEIGFNGVSNTIENTIPLSCGFCGNSIVEGNEQCDDGNFNHSDSCSLSCQTSTEQASCTVEILETSGNTMPVDVMVKVNAPQDQNWNRQLLDFGNGTTYTTPQLRNQKTQYTTTYREDGEYTISFNAINNNRQTISCETTINLQEDAGTCQNLFVDYETSEIICIGKGGSDFEITFTDESGKLVESLTDTIDQSGSRSPNDITRMVVNQKDYTLPGKLEDYTIECQVDGNPVNTEGTTCEAAAMLPLQICNAGQNDPQPSIYQEEAPTITLNGPILSISIPNTVRNTVNDTTYYADSFSLLQFDSNGALLSTNIITTQTNNYALLSATESVVIGNLGGTFFEIFINFEISNGNIVWSGPGNEYFYCGSLSYCGDNGTQNPNTIELGGTTNTGDEECDGGVDCTNYCTDIVIICGDGNRESPSEQCDEGTGTEGDGSGIIDDTLYPTPPGGGNNPAYGGRCQNNCETLYCGDLTTSSYTGYSIDPISGVMDPSNVTYIVEQCDQGDGGATNQTDNNGNNYNCTAGCQLQYCGDNQINTYPGANGTYTGEQCDQGLTGGTVSLTGLGLQGDGIGFCTNKCQVQYCGNYVVEENSANGIDEVCDQGPNGGIITSGSLLGYFCDTQCHVPLTQCEETISDIDYTFNHGSNILDIETITCGGFTNAGNGNNAMLFSVVVNGDVVIQETEPANIGQQTITLSGNNGGGRSIPITGSRYGTALNLILSCRFQGEASPCNESHTIAYCGDGVKQGGVSTPGDDEPGEPGEPLLRAGPNPIRTEACDDGNNINGDGCTSCRLDPLVCKINVTPDSGDATLVTTVSISGTSSWAIVNGFRGIAGSPNFPINHVSGRVDYPFEYTQTGAYIARLSISHPYSSTTRESCVWDVQVDEPTSEGNCYTMIDVSYDTCLPCQAKAESLNNDPYFQNIINNSSCGFNILAIDNTQGFPQGSFAAWMSMFSGTFAGDNSTAVSLDYLSNNFPGMVFNPYCVIQDEDGNTVSNIDGNCNAASAFMEANCTSTESSCDYTPSADSVIACNELTSIWSLTGDSIVIDLLACAGSGFDADYSINIFSGGAESIFITSGNSATNQSRIFTGNIPSPLPIGTTYDIICEVAGNRCNDQIEITYCGDGITQSTGSGNDLGQIELCDPNNDTREGPEGVVCNDDCTLSTPACTDLDVVRSGTYDHFDVSEIECVGSGTLFELSIIQNQPNNNDTTLLSYSGGIWTGPLYADTGSYYTVECAIDSLLSCSQDLTYCGDGITQDGSTGNSLGQVEACDPNETNPSLDPGEICNNQCEIEISHCGNISITQQPISNTYTCADFGDALDELQPGGPDGTSDIHTELSAFCQDAGYGNMVSAVSLLGCEETGESPIVVDLELNCCASCGDDIFVQGPYSGYDISGEIGEVDEDCEIGDPSSIPAGFVCNELCKLMDLDAAGVYKTGYYQSGIIYYTLGFNFPGSGFNLLGMDSKYTEIRDLPLEGKKYLQSVTRTSSTLNGLPSIGNEYSTLNSYGYIYRIEEVKEKNPLTFIDNGINKMKMTLELTLKPRAQLELELLNTYGLPSERPENLTVCDSVGGRLGPMIDGEMGPAEIYLTDKLCVDIPIITLIGEQSSCIEYCSYTLNNISSVTTENIYQDTTIDTRTCDWSYSCSDIYTNEVSSEGTFSQPRTRINTDTKYYTSVDNSTKVIDCYDPSKHVSNTSYETTKVRTVGTTTTKFINFCEESRCVGLDIKGGIDTGANSIRTYIDQVSCITVGTGDKTIAVKTNYPLYTGLFEQSIVIQNGTDQQYYDQRTIDTDIFIDNNTRTITTCTINGSTCYYYMTDAWCGNGYINSNYGEECDPPENGGGDSLLYCDNECKLINNNAECGELLVALAIDTSESISPGDLDEIKTITTSFSNSILSSNTGSKVGIINFDVNANEVQPPTDDSQSVTDAINGLTLVNVPGTDIPGAMTIGASMLNQSFNGNKLLIMLTDGKPNNGNNYADWNAVRNAYTQANGAGAEVIVIHFGSAVPGGWQNSNTPATDFVIKADDAADLGPIFDSLTNNDCAPDPLPSGCTETGVMYTGYQTTGGLMLTDIVCYGQGTGDYEITITPDPNDSQTPPPWTGNAGGTGTHIFNPLSGSAEFLLLSGTYQISCAVGGNSTGTACVQDVDVTAIPFCDVNSVQGDVSLNLSSGEILFNQIDCAYYNDIPGFFSLYISGTTNQIYNNIFPPLPHIIAPPFIGSLGDPYQIRCVEKSGVACDLDIFYCGDGITETSTQPLNPNQIYITTGNIYSDTTIIESCDPNDPLTSSGFIYGPNQEEIRWECNDYCEMVDVIEDIAVCSGISYTGYNTQTGFMLTNIECRGEGAGDIIIEILPDPNDPLIPPLRTTTNTTNGAQLFNPFSLIGAQPLHLPKPVGPPWPTQYTISCSIDGQTSEQCSQTLIVDPPVECEYIDTDVEIINGELVFSQIDCNIWNYDRNPSHRIRTGNNYITGAFIASPWDIIPPYIGQMGHPYTTLCLVVGPSCFQNIYYCGDGIVQNNYTMNGFDIYLSGSQQLGSGTVINEECDPNAPGAINCSDSCQTEAFECSLVVTPDNGTTSFEVTADITGTTPLDFVAINWHYNIFTDDFLDITTLAQGGQMFYNHRMSGTGTYTVALQIANPNPTSEDDRFIICTDEVTLTAGTGCEQTGQLIRGHKIIDGVFIGNTGNNLLATPIIIDNNNLDDLIEALEGIFPQVSVTPDASSSLPQIPLTITVWGVDDPIYFHLAGNAVGEPPLNNAPERVILDSPCLEGQCNYLTGQVEILTGASMINDVQINTLVCQGIGVGEEVFFLLSGDDILNRETISIITPWSISREPLPQFLNGGSEYTFSCRSSGNIVDDSTCDMVVNYCGDGIIQGPDQTLSTLPNYYLAPGQGDYSTGLFEDPNFNIVLGEACDPADGIEYEGTNPLDPTEIVSYICDNSCSLLPCPVEIVFVLDNSGSMGGTRRSQMVAAVNSFLDELEDDESLNAGVALVTYQRRVDNQTEILWNDYSEIRNILNGLNGGGTTNVAGGYMTAIDILETQGRTNNQYILLLTDGQANQPFSVTQGANWIIQDDDVNGALESYTENGWSTLSSLMQQYNIWPTIPFSVTSSDIDLDIIKPVADLAISNGIETHMIGYGNSSQLNWYANNNVYSQYYAASTANIDDVFGNIYEAIDCEPTPTSTGSAFCTDIELTDVQVTITEGVTQIQGACIGSGDTVSLQVSDANGVIITEDITNTSSNFTMTTSILPEGTNYTVTCIFAGAGDNPLCSQEILYCGDGQTIGDGSSSTDYRPKPITTPPFPEECDPADQLTGTDQGVEWECNTMCEKIYTGTTTSYCEYITGSVQVLTGPTMINSLIVDPLTCFGSGLGVDVFFTITGTEGLNRNTIPLISPRSIDRRNLPQGLLGGDPYTFACFTQDDLEAGLSCDRTAYYCGDGIIHSGEDLNSLNTYYFVDGQGLTSTGYFIDPDFEIVDGEYCDPADGVLYSGANPLDPTETVSYICDNSCSLLPCPVEVILVLDNSSSMVSNGSDKGPLMKAAAKAFIQNLKDSGITAGVGVTVYGSSLMAATDIVWNGYEEPGSAVMTTIDNMTFPSSTNILAGYAKAMQILTEQGRTSNQYIILLTDGGANGPLGYFPTPYVDDQRIIKEGTGYYYSNYLNDISLLEDLGVLTIPYEIPSSQNSTRGANFDLLNVASHSAQDNGIETIMIGYSLGNSLNQRYSDNIAGSFFPAATTEIDVVFDQVYEEIDCKPTSVNTGSASCDDIELTHATITTQGLIALTGQCFGSGTTLELDIQYINNNHVITTILANPFTEFFTNISTGEPYSVSCLYDDITNDECNTNIYYCGDGVTQGSGWNLPAGDYYSDGTNFLSDGRNEACDPAAHNGIGDNPCTNDCKVFCSDAQYTGFTLSGGNIILESVSCEWLIDGYLPQNPTFTLYADNNIPVACSYTPSLINPDFTNLSVTWANITCDYDSNRTSATDFKIICDLN